MSLIRDQSAIRARLSADRPWSVYALGDLAPGMFEHTRWHAGADGQALLLLFSALDIPVLFAIGSADGVAELLAEIEDQERLYLSIQAHILPLIQARYVVSHQKAMWRMVLHTPLFTPRPSRAARLTSRDYPALTRLYADGAAAGETPDFFALYMVEQGVFYGIFEGQELVAAAGTHLVAPSEGVAAVGNVYTRRDHRGHGLAAQVTGAVTAELVATLPPDPVIALNVIQTNTTAIGVYERLGFTRYCEFYEGIAARRESATG